MAIFLIRRRRVLICWILALLCGFLAVAGLVDSAYYRERIYPGVRLKGVDLGGMKLSEARTALQNLEMVFAGPGGDTLEVPLSELGVTAQVEKILEQAFSRGREHLPPRAWWERLKLRREGAFLSPAYRLDGEMLLHNLAYLEQTFGRTPVDASLRVNDAGKMVIVPESPGYRVIRVELLEKLLHTLEHSRAPLVTSVPCEQVPPELTEQSLREQGITALISTFTTSFDPGNPDRVHNLALAASVLDNRIFAPGETVSVNGIIGDTTPEKGYRKAPVMAGDALVPGYGGGICQISSTLYCAALLAGLEIIERHNHAMTVPYVDPGWDATIDYGSRDMKFRNNTAGSIMIKATIEEDKLTFYIFGTPANYHVVIEITELAVYQPPVEYVFDPELPPGTSEVDEGNPGCLVEVWKITYHGSEVTGREIISLDYYRPYPTVIRFGPSGADLLNKGSWNLC